MADHRRTTTTTASNRFVDDRTPREPVGDRRRLASLPGGGYLYSLIDDAVSIEVRYLRRDRGLHGEVDVRCEWTGRKRLSCAELNLSSQTARVSLAKYCAERARTADDAFDWRGAIDDVCLAVIEAERHGDDPIVLDDAPALAHHEVDLYGLHIPTDAPSMFVAHGDGLKSMLTLLVLGSLALRGQPVLFVDWEWTAERHKARKIRLFGPARIDTLHYLKCRAPLVIECDRIRRFCDAHRIEFLGVDSVGLACDGKLIDDDVALRFHRALAYLPPSICAAHVPKSAIAADAKTEPTAFGSVYFTNLCRSVWSVKKQTGISPDLVTIGIFQTKQNDGDRSRPVGLELEFTPDRIDVREVNVADVTGLAEQLPLAVRMREALRHAPLTYHELTARLDVKENTIVQTVKRKRDLFTVVQSPDGVQRIGLVERRTTTG